MGSAVLLAAGVAGFSPAAASTLVVQGDNTFSGAFAVRISLLNSCSFDNHEIVTGTLSISGQFVACNSLTSDATIDAGLGAVGFTAGERVALVDGFRVMSGSLVAELDPALYFDAWLQDDSPAGAQSYSARFHVDASGLTMDDGYEFLLLVASDAAGAPEFRIGLRKVSTEHRVYLEVISDDGGVATTLDLVLSAGWHHVDVHWQASTGFSDGRAYLCVDSEPPVGCTELANLSNAGGAIDSVRWGAMDLPPSSDLGQLDLDDFSSTALDDDFESGTTDAWSARAPD
ncbi:MAG TPA: hypothetical protein VFG21_05670 [Xanthomonadaceae bacterium]|nr:hypothetical protein [Xanthomonadaceae bacterium]